ncbi:MAG TPA: hypothetical protein VJH68_03520 [Candidatus Nanoarchaeia archaeon]|nr:hypothetical protein [Candidatus Nanoarchaeia archaeon]
MKPRHLWRGEAVSQLRIFSIIFLSVFHSSFLLSPDNLFSILLSINF